MSDVLAPRCPGCDMPPALQLGDSQAFCGNEECRVFTWNPLDPPERFKATAVAIDLPDLNSPE
jgi:hypothetical protein